MLDTMTLTKIAGAFCGALLVFLLGKWAAEIVYHGGGHGGDHAQAYMIDTGSDDEAADVAEEGPSFAELWAAADVEKGAKVFGKCKACHKLEDGANATGPYLYAVVNREVSAASGFGYSGSLKPVVDVWTPQELDAFLENPKGYAPGTSMGFAGLKKPQDRVDVIAYLDMTDGDLTEIAAPAAAESAMEDVTADEATEVEVEATPKSEAAAEEATEEPAAEEASETEATEEEAVAEEPATEEPVEESASEAAEEEATETEMAAVEEPAAEEPATEEAAADASGFAQLVAAADVEAGSKVFRKCMACHKLEDGKNGAGPSLFGIIGKDIASVEGFTRYSDALLAAEGEWTLDKLNAWIENPREVVPGNRMGFPGLKDEADRAAVVAYIQNAAQ